MRKEPNRIKLNDTPLPSREVRKIPLPPIDPMKYDAEYCVKPDNDSIYKPIDNEDIEQNNS